MINFDWIGIRKIFRNLFNWTRQKSWNIFDWIGIRKIFRNRFNWTRQGLGLTLTGSASEKSLGIDLTGPDKVLECLQLEKNQGDLRVDLTEPEKAFDWISIRKILGSI